MLQTLLYSVTSMPRYSYRAKDGALRLVRGMIEAETEHLALTRLNAQGVYPLTLNEASPADAPSPATRHRRVPTRVLAYMSRQLADLLGGGIPLFNALALLAEQTEHRALREVIAELSAAVRDGQAFSQALAAHPDIFPPLYVSMIRAGEVGGGLEAVLVRLADVAEQEVELTSRVVSALVYPLVVLAVGVATIVVLLTYVVPKLSVLFAESGQLLPLPTRLLLSLSYAMTRGWWVIVLGIVAGVWSLRRLRASGAGRGALDRVLLRVPVLGLLMRKLDTARLSRNLGVMVAQGVPMLHALEIAQATVSNSAVRHAVAQMKEAVRDGVGLAAAMHRTGAFPRFVGNMVAVGEESGTLEGALLKVASAYERETDRVLRMLTTVMEPLLIVVVGLIVMFIVIATLLPIFQIGLVAQ